MIEENLHEKWWKENLRSYHPEHYNRLYGKGKSWDSVCEPFRQLAAELEQSKPNKSRKKARTNKKKKLGNI